MPEAFPIAEFSMVIAKAAYDKATGEKRIQLVASDTDEDAYDEKMSMELFSDFTRRIDQNESAPEQFRSDFWQGGMPYLSIAHYNDLDGKAVPGIVKSVYIDGNRLKSKAVLSNTPLGEAVWRAVCDDMYGKSEHENKVRVSIGFLDLAHSHGALRFERQSLSDKCPMCAMGMGEKTYLKGQLVHLAFTRVPVNERTSVSPDSELEEESMTTRKEDAASIIGDELASEIEKESQMVGKSEALVERAEEEEVLTEESKKMGDKKMMEDKKPMMDDEEECPDDEESEKGCGKKKVKKSVEEVRESQVAVPQVDEPSVEITPHILDRFYAQLKSEFDKQVTASASEQDKLVALQTPLNSMIEEIKAQVTKSTVKPVDAPASVAPAFDAEALKSVLVSAMKEALTESLTPLADNVKVLTTQLSAVQGAQSLVSNSMPQRRSVAPQSLGALPAEPKKLSIHELVARSVY